VLNFQKDEKLLKEDLEVLNKIKNADYPTQKKLLKKGLIRQLKDQTNDIYISKKYYDEEFSDKNIKQRLDPKHGKYENDFLEKSNKNLFFWKEINKMVISFFKILEKHPDKISENGIYFEEDLFLLEDFGEYLEEIGKRLDKWREINENKHK
jgi:hypothetical protein